MKRGALAFRSVRAFHAVQHRVYLAATHFSAFINPDFPVWRFKVLFCFFPFSLYTYVAHRGTPGSCINELFFNYLLARWSHVHACRAHVCMYRLQNATFCTCFLHIITCMTWHSTTPVPNGCTICWPVFFFFFQWVQAGFKACIEDGGDNVYHSH